MTIAAELLAEFERETPTTRKFLERIPESQFEWRPHGKSMTAGQLALHMSVAPGQVIQMATLDVAEAPKFNDTRQQPAGRAEVIQALEESVRTVGKILPSFDDEQMRATWRLRIDGKEVLAIPRAMLVRNILLNHWYHHRGQLGVYLRLMGAKVPSSYGPSGDEMPEFLNQAEAR